MGLFDLFKSLRPASAGIRIQFPDNFEESSAVAVMIECNVRPTTEIWIWDLYFVKTLFDLGECDAADGVRHELEMWCDEWFDTLVGGEVPAECLWIDSSLTLLPHEIQDAETYTIEIIDREGDWPTIQTHLPRKAFQNRAAYSALALAQKFIQMYPVYFPLRLAIHVRAMRRYFMKGNSPYQLGSVLGAPAYALRSASEFLDRAPRSQQT